MFTVSLRGLPIVLLGLLSGCASTANDNAIKIERTLAAAGFQVKLADTPEKLAHLQQLGQRRLIPINKDDKVMYFYADAESCKCLYVGTEADYQEFQRFAIQQHVVQEQRQTAETEAMNQANMAEMNAAVNWPLWGPWRRPFYY
jgi:translation initiation factor IF-1